MKINNLEVIAFYHFSVYLYNCFKSLHLHNVYHYILIPAFYGNLKFNQKYTLNGEEI